MQSIKTLYSNYRWETITVGGWDYTNPKDIKNTAQKTVTGIFQEFQTGRGGEYNLGFFTEQLYQCWIEEGDLLKELALGELLTICNTNYEVVMCKYHNAPVTRISPFYEVIIKRHNDKTNNIS